MASDATLSVGIHPYGNHMCVFALCRDFKLRIWSCQVLWKYCNKYFSKASKLSAKHLFNIHLCGFFFFLSKWSFKCISNPFTIKIP